MEGIYLYGIVGFPPPLSRQILGLGRSPVFLVPQRDLAAVVSWSPLMAWSVGELHLGLHESVVEEVMRTRPILPVRFNTVFKTIEAVSSVLGERAQRFRSALERVAGKVEMGLRVLWKPPAEAPVPAEQAITRTGPGTEYLHRRRTEEQRRARIRAGGERLIREVQARVQPLATESWLQRFPTDRQFVRSCNGFQVSTAAGNSAPSSLLFTGAYLVDQDRLEAFRESVMKAQRRFPHLGFLLTGPWPPYHFVNGANHETADTAGACELSGGV